MKSTKAYISKTKIQGQDGFSITDILVATSLSCLFGIAMQGAIQTQLKLMSDDHKTIRSPSTDELDMALEILERDIKGNHYVSLEPQSESTGCDLKGGHPVLHLRSNKGLTITYSVSDSPTSIWRSPVLMRCSQYGAGGSSVNLVLIDGLRVNTPASPWPNCSTLFRPVGISASPSTNYVDLGKSSTLGFSACKQPLLHARSVGIRLILDRVNPLTKTNYQVEQLINYSS